MDDLVTVVSGAWSDVVMQPSVKREYDKHVDAQARATVERIMALYAQEGPRDLPNTQFKSEGQFSTGEKKEGKAHIYAFKAWQVRVYGAQCTLGQRRRFICSEIDVSKKKTKADQECLRRAARNLRGFV